MQKSEGSRRMNTNRIFTVRQPIARSGRKKEEERGKGTLLHIRNQDLAVLFECD